MTNIGNFLFSQNLVEKQQRTWAQLHGDCLETSTISVETDKKGTRSEVATMAEETVVKSGNEIVYEIRSEALPFPWNKMNELNPHCKKCGKTFVHLNTLEIHEKKPSCDYVKPVKSCQRKLKGKKTETVSEGESVDDSIIRCICGSDYDDGRFMISCDMCLVWQHVECVGLDEDTIPNEYFCDMCERPSPTIDCELTNAAQTRKVIKKKKVQKPKFITNRGKVCRCGSTKVLAVPLQGNGEGQKRSKVHVGGKRKVRCKECTGCLADNCKICKYCRLTHLKKACVERKCLFPVEPKCPCFN